METEERKPKAERRHRREGPGRRERQSQREGAAHQRSRPANRQSSLLGDLLKGAVAGAVGVIALDQITWAMWDREDPEALQREREARPGGLDPAHVVANRMAEAMGTKLTPKQPHAAGIAVHYGLGILPGAIYGALRKRAPIVGTGAGTAFGLALFLLQDEGLNPMIGTSGSPGEYPWQAHARGVVGHAVMGAIMDATLDMLDRAFEPIRGRE